MQIWWYRGMDSKIERRAAVNGERSRQVQMLPGGHLLFLLAQSARHFHVVFRAQWRVCGRAL